MTPGAAHRAVRRAIDRGKLIRPDHCQECGRNGPVHAHHHDYDRPLDVTWLCDSCHVRRHRGDTCKRGHDLSPDSTNTRLYRGRRYCRACTRMHTAAWRRRQNETPTKGTP